MASRPSEKDLQELLRLLTTTRKLSMMQAMGHVRALQAAHLKSIQQIADAPAAEVEAALKDGAAAKSLQNSCKAALKKQGSKRGAAAESSTSTLASSSKRTRRASPDMFAPASMTPAELERSLELPVATAGGEEDKTGEEDGGGEERAEKEEADRRALEDRLASTVLLTNRAPLVLAFAVELLRYTMPEQPPSSRLSLAQAVVSANSRSKAVSLGLEKAAAATENDWAAGQPRVRILGREVAVLKRSGYTWRGAETESVEEKEAAEAGGASPEGQERQERQEKETKSRDGQHAQPPGVWSVSQTISLRGSTFVARATTMTDVSQRPGLLRGLMAAHPQLLTATHNAWAYRVRASYDAAAGDGVVRQDSYDDGETGCGPLMLHVLAELGAVDTLVVLTRWFGGTMLGPDRWRLMRNSVTGALAQRLRRTGAEVNLSGEALWGLDVEDKSSSSGSSKNNSSSQTLVVGMPTHRPESARQYLLKSFARAEDTDTALSASASASPAKKKKMTKAAADAEKEENLSLLLGALRMLYDSWADHVTAAELDRRAWSWYVAVRPDVDSGPAGWGAKGPVKLQALLDLRRPASG